jgi:hypothetical protein
MKVFIECMKSLLHCKKRRELKASIGELQWHGPLLECERCSIANGYWQLLNPFCLDLVVHFRICSRVPHP